MWRRDDNCLTSSVSLLKLITTSLKDYKVAGKLRTVMEDILTKSGIIHQFTVPYAPEQNTKADRKSMSFQESKMSI